MAIRWPLVIRRTHKWLALIVGVQVLLWTLTGFYMVAVHIDIIHGDDLVRPPVVAPIDLASFVPPARIVQSAPDAPRSACNGSWISPSGARKPRVVQDSSMQVRDSPSPI